MKPLFEASSINPETKDLTMINNIVSKSGGDVAKAAKLAQQMAKAIKDPAKMARRYQAAVQILGEDHPVTKAFEVAKSSEPVPKTGKPALEFIKDLNPTIYNNIIAAFKVKKLDFTKVDASKIQKLDQKAAFKYGGTEGDKYFKIWMIDDEIAFCTWANTMIDNRFNWNHKGKGTEKRIYANIIGTQPHIDGYFKSNSYLNNITTVYMIPFTAFGPAAVDMVEDERAKFFGTKEAMANSEFLVDQYHLFTEAKNFMEKQRKEVSNKLSKLVPNTKVVITENSGSFFMQVNGSDIYSEGGTYGPALIHDWWFLLTIPELNYGPYDWDGHTHSENASYDGAVKELKKAGVKLTFASDCKKQIRKFIKLAKDNPDYIAFCEALASYNEIKKAYNGDALVKSLKGEALEYLKNIVTIDKFGDVIINGNEFSMTYHGGTSIKFSPFFSASTPKTIQAARVKAIVNRYPEIFSTFKRDGTIIPGLVLNPDIVKNLKVKTK